MNFKLESGLELLRQIKPFYSLLLLNIKLKETKEVETCSVSFDDKIDKFIMYVNNDFIDTLNISQVCGVLIHELLHIVHNHLFRFSSKYNIDLANIVMDLAVNQYIEGRLLPTKAVSLGSIEEQFKIKLEPFQTWEYYYNQLINTKKVQQILDTFSILDTHKPIECNNKGATSEERTRIIRKALEDEKSFSNCPDFLKEEFYNYKNELAKLDYHSILKRIIRKSIIKNQKRTYSRLNKRYGQQVKGCKDNKVARLGIYVDTSGSISEVEIGQEIEVIQNFSKISKTDIFVSFFHTSIYNSIKLLNKTTIKFDVVECGGTNLACVIEDIHKNKNDLNIIITDGFYDTVDIINKPVLFLITKGGKKDHTLDNYGYTLEIKN